MNFLAHAYLSFNIPGIFAGNMMGDFVKGKQKNLFPEEIRKGIELHWFIDSFTDTHPVTYKAKQIFKPAAQLYAGLFTDVSFDYFLAKDESIKSDDEWQQFAEDTYKTIETFRPYFPEGFATLFGHMRQHNWLYNYRYLKQIQNSFKNVSLRAKYLFINYEEAFTTFQNNIPFLKDCYDEFFPELKEAVSDRLR
ncbi:MAG: ACP phosphodiesterase [Arachidicoccus sp.]|nr:ACP phosphodiesterase [Arachidicoccus sp.]